MMHEGWILEASPFHAGEQAIQDRVGRREEMERFGRRIIRPFMPDQHREFFAALPFAVIGALDADGRPWASLAFGRPGFLTAPERDRLDLTTQFHPDDPVGGALEAGAPVGLLGVELASRRRNRVNGRVVEKEGARRVIAVDQSFGNCPQYIQNRALTEVLPAPAKPGLRAPGLSSADHAMIAAADTFFVASATPARDHPWEGVDVSHRGGRPGFVKVEGDILTIPDFTGNFHFNTLGNFAVYPRAGLVFVDFETGDILSLTGAVEILWDEADYAHFAGAERAWRFTVEQAIRLPAASPLRWRLDEVSPNSALTGVWAEAEALAEADKQRETWKTMRIARIVEESAVIRSIYLEPADGSPTLDHEAGQHLPVRIDRGDGEPLVRTYTLSSAPGDKRYRLSIKKEAGGAVSSWAHETLKEGDLIEAKAPRGGFWMNAADPRPAVLIGGGVGITPMISMARHAAIEGFRTRRARPLTVIHAARSAAERAFAREFADLEAGSQGALRYVAVTSGEDRADGDRPVRIDANLLQELLGFADYEFFLCGPARFMQAMYDLLRALGVADDRIRAEAFGPSALTRTGAPAPAQGAPAAEEALVVFEESGVEQRWEAADGPLLDFAEQHGFAPDYGCRNGACGSCAVKLLAGQVSYDAPPSAAHGEDEALICCARPAAGSETVRLGL